MFVKRLKRARMNVRVPTEIRIPSYLQFLRGCACLIADHAKHECEGPIEPHHVKDSSDASMGRKGPDNRCVPLCSFAHTELHSNGAETFERRYSRDLIKSAADYWKAWPGRRNWEVKHLDTAQQR